MECQIRKHDDHQFEIKVTYSLDQRRPRERYNLSLFIFFPYQLWIDESTYPRRQFYDDLSSYTRFKTPEFSAAELNNPDLAESPLTRIRRGIAAGNSTGAWDSSRLIYEMRMLAAVVRVHVRETTSYLLTLAKSSRFEDLMVAGGRFMDSLESLLGNVRKLREDLLGSSVPEKVVQAFDLMDEYVSLQVEYLLLRLVQLLTAGVAKDARIGVLQGRLHDMARAESGHRLSRGHKTVVSHDDRRNEYLLYRESLLKKFSSNVLFLSVDRRQADVRAQHALSLSAAGIAMTLGVIGLWLSSRYWPQNMLALGLTAILVYMVRDRVKEVMKQHGSRILPRWTSDRRGMLVDRQYGQEVGATRERVRWVTRDTMEDVVHQARQYEDSLERQVSEPTEQVLHYRKDVEISADTIFANHKRAAAVDEILRLQVGPWTERMDNARKTLLLAEGPGNGISKVEARRVYHVNVIACLTSCATHERLLKKARLVLSRNGIERIEL